MPVERDIGSTLVGTRPVIRTTSPVEMESLERVATLTDTPADAKEFSLDTADAVDSKGPYSVICGGCFPPPPGPPPKCR